MPIRFFSCLLCAGALTACSGADRLQPDDAVNVEFAAEWEKNAIKDGIPDEVAKKAGDCARKQIATKLAAAGKQSLSRSEAMPIIIECTNEATD
jgi:hypothetical protein